MSNPNTNSISQQLAERRSRLAQSHPLNQANNIASNPNTLPPNHHNEMDDFEYAKQLQQQFDTEDNNHNHHSNVAADIPSDDIDTDDIEMLDDLSTNNKSQSVIDEDHEIALQLQRQFDNEESNVPQPSDNNNNNNNHTNINIHSQMPSNMNPFSSSFSSNNAGTTIITTRTGPDGQIIRTVTTNNNNNNNNNNNPMNDSPNPFNHPFFQQNMSGFNHPFFQMSRQNHNNNNHNNANPFDDPFFQNMGGVNGMNPQMLNMNMMINNMMMGDGMHGFGFMQPRPRVANQENVDALPTDTYRVKTNAKKSDKEEDEVKEEVNKKESCSICLEEFKDGEEIRRLPCLHIFHKNEIDRWLLTGADKCPICRVPINGQIQ